MDLEYPNETIEAIAGHIEEILRLLGEDPQREGLLKTPVRAAKVYKCIHFFIHFSVVNF